MRSDRVPALLAALFLIFSVFSTGAGVWAAGAHKRLSRVRKQWEKGRRKSSMARLREYLKRGKYEATTYGMAGDWAAETGLTWLAVAYYSKAVTLCKKGPCRSRLSAWRKAMGGLKAHNLKLALSALSRKRASKPKSKTPSRKKARPVSPLTVALFCRGRAGIPPANHPNLALIAGVMAGPAKKGARFLMTTHTGPRGSSGFNLAISERRARSVCRYLIKKLGVSRRALTCRGMGESRPLSRSYRLWDRQANRRIEIVRTD